MTINVRLWRHGAHLAHLHHAEGRYAPDLGEGTGGVNFDGEKKMVHGTNHHRWIRWGLYIYNIILRLYIWLYPIIVYRSYQIIEIQSDFCLNENCMDLMNPWSFPGVWVDQMILKYSFWTTWDIIKEVTYERWGSSYERMRVAGPHGILIKIACIELLSLGSTVITNSASPITIIHGDSINQLWGDCWDISIIFLKYISYNLNIDRIYKQ